MNYALCRAIENYRAGWRNSRRGTDYPHLNVFDLGSEIITLGGIDMYLGLRQMVDVDCREEES